MSPTEFEYHRPQSLEQALDLLGRAAPLGGGTALTPRRADLAGVMDLQDLDLGGNEPRDDRLVLGAGMRLQSLAEGIPGLPPALPQACRLEAGWNLRNQATLAGAIVTGDGRLPLLAALLALDAAVSLEPGGEQVPLEELLARRPGSVQGRLIVRLSLAHPALLSWESVARSPADRPLVCAAVSRLGSGAAAGWRVVLGGQGAHPLRVREAEVVLQTNGAKGPANTADAAGRAAAAAYSAAGDAWASAEYRAAAAGALVRRLAHGILRP